MQVTKFNLVTDLQIMLFNVTHSNSNFECNKEKGYIDQLYIELGFLGSIYRTSKDVKSKKKSDEKIIGLKVDQIR